VLEAMGNKTENSLRNAAIEARALKIVDEIDINIAVVDHTGTIIATNLAWRKFAAHNCKAEGTFPLNIGESCNYLDICRNAFGPSSEGALRVYDGIRGVLDGKSKSFYQEYPCHSPDRQRWFSMKVKPLPGSKPREVMILHEEITDRMVAMMESQSRERALSDALLQLQTLASDINNYLNLPRSRLPSSAALASPGNMAEGAALLRTLSIRELEVLKGLIRGERNGAIAERLELSVKSVSTYRSRILKKLKLESNADLVAFSSKSGFFF
jgi:DNA-binding CsgD family transcriptional regulator